MQQLPDDQGNNDRRPGRKHSSGRAHEVTRDYDAEDGIDHQQNKEDDHHEESARAAANNIFRQSANRTSFVAGARPYGTKVVNAGEEDRSARHTEHRRPPAPVHRNRGPDDRRRAGYRREMVAPEDVLICRMKVDTIV